MRDLVHAFIARRIDRRGFVKAMLAGGFSAVAAESVLAALTPMAEAAGPAAAGKFRTVQGTGSYLLLQQIKEAGVKHVFYGNGTSSASLLDAMVGDNDIHLILGPEENIVTAMASGYAMTSNAPTFANVHGTVGTAHQMLNMFNAKKDGVPLVISSFTTTTRETGRDGFEWVDDLVSITRQFTRWSFEIPETDRVPEIARNAMRIATTPPGGPSYLSIPTNVAEATATATIVPKEYFTIPLTTEPDPRLVEKAAQMLLEAKKPFMVVGIDVWRSNAYDEVVALAELVGLQVVQGLSPYTDFPTDHPLYVGASDYGVGGMRTLKDADLMLDMGAHAFYAPVSQDVTIIDCRSAPDDVARVNPTALSIIADPKMTAKALIEAVSRSATAAHKAAAKQRIEDAAAFNQKFLKAREEVLAARRDSVPIAWERVAQEANQILEKDAILTHEFGSAIPRVLPWFDLARGKKETYGRTIGSGLGWSVGASIGIKMAKPDRQVACLLGDGAFLMGQIEALWAARRFEAPVLYIVFNNRSFNDTRMRADAVAPRMREAGIDLGSYLGNPDVSFEQAAKAFDVKGATVTKPGEIAAALQTGVRELKDGRPFVIDVLAERVGPLADSTWYPKYSIADRRTKPV